MNIINNSTSYFSIISVFRMIDNSIHLSRLAKLIGKNKSTTLVHLDNLLDESPPFIEIDAERTLNTRGSKKFYKLSSFSRQALQYQQSLLKQRLDQYSIDFGSIKNSDFSNLVKTQMVKLIESFGPQGTKNYLSLGAELNHNIESMATNQYLDLAMRIHKAQSKGKELDEIQMPKISFGTFLNRSIQIKVNHVKHIEKIQQESIAFLRKMESLQEEFQEEITNQIDEGLIDREDVGIQNIYVGLAPILREY